MADTRAVQVLTPILSRVVTTHCWMRRGDSIVHLREPLTMERMARHMNGGPYYGCTQIRAGESTTRIALFDLDAHDAASGWDAMRATAIRIASAALERGLAAIPFRSSGGHGIHLYFLWDEPQNAAGVRATLQDVLQACGLTSGTGGLALSQIEIFPKQDSVPHDGWGSMAVLPLANQSVPLDPFSMAALTREDAAHIPWPVSQPVPEAVRQPEEPCASMPETEADLVQLQQALDAIPNSGTDELDYDRWRDVVFGIHHATGGSPDGLALALTFSARSGKHNPEFLEQRVWPYIGKSSAPPITARSIFRLASEYGWDSPESDLTVSDSVRSEPSYAPDKASSSFAPVLERASETPLPDIIRGVIPDAQFGVIYGAPGAGKSFIAIDIGFHIALGREWRGRKVRQRPVFYVAAEGALGVRRRATAWASHYEVLSAPFYTRETPIDLRAKNGWVKAAEDITALSQTGVIFVDTLSRSIPGAEENSAKDMGAVIANCHALSRATSCPVIVIAHAGKDEEKGVRGSTAVHAAADFELHVTRYEQTPYRQVTLSKSRDDMDGAVFGFVLQQVETGVDAEGETVFSAVAAVSDHQQEKSVKRNATERAVLKAYEELSELSSESWISIDKIVDQVLAGRQDVTRQNRYDVRKYMSGVKKLAEFDVFDGKVRLRNGVENDE